MSIADWVIFLFSITIIFIIAAKTGKHVRTVADFLAGGRTAGRYLLTSANGMAGMGLITIIAYMQKFYHAGWAIEWWNTGTVVLCTILALSGYVFYRFRETRALTLAQFFEMRYDRPYRIFMGIICWISGIINFGIFPAISANFFICFLGLPETLCGIPTYPLLMLLFLGGACIITVPGGQIQNMITDTVQSLMVYTMSVAIAIVILWMFPLGEFKNALLSQPVGMSFINPFDTAKISDFNFSFFLITLYMIVTQWGAWQGNQGYAASALNPHEAKMGNILGTWRQLSLTLFSITFALGGLVVLYSATYGELAKSLCARLNASLPAAIADQMIMPMAIAELLPIGLKGVLATVLFFFMLSTDTTYIHSWGSIFVQDVILPIYGKKISQRKHLLLLRLSLISVAVFAFFFSLFYQQSEYINMFQILTGSLFASSAGCALIGGLYWKRATRGGAWASMGVGFIMSLFSIILLDVRGWGWARQSLLLYFPDSELLSAATEKCPFNGAELAFFSSLTAGLTFILISLCSCRKSYNLDKLLNRSATSIKSATTQAPSKISVIKRLLLGFDEEFTLHDKIISVSVAVWTFGWGIAFFIISLWNILGWILPDSILKMWPAEWWFYYLIIFVGAHVVLGPITAVWMTLGSWCDLKRVFHLLASEKHCSDDGYVE